MRLRAGSEPLAYKSNEQKLDKYLQKRFLIRENEWDRRHVPYEIANAEHLAMSDSARHDKSLSLPYHGYSWV